MIDNEVIQAIEAILKRGNNAEVRRKGDGVIVLEVQKKNQISIPGVIGRREGQ